MVDQLLPPEQDNRVSNLDHAFSELNTSAHNASEASPAPRRARVRKGSHGAGTAAEAAGMSQLAPETLVRIFSYLDPRSLARCSSTCRLWHELLQSDTTWRNAFSVAFGLEEREERIEQALRSGQEHFRALRVAPALRRISADSWCAEYSQRVARLRCWRKSRTPTILSDPRISTLDSIALSASRQYVLSLSHGFSIASRSNAFTGKVVKDFLDANGFASMGANGRPNIEFSPATTAMAADALATRIVWGHRTGEVSLTTIEWRGRTARGTVRNRTFPLAVAHRAAVASVAFPFPAVRGGAHSAEVHKQRLAQAADAAGTFATGGADGSVHVWLPKFGAPIWTGSTQPLPRPNTQPPPAVYSTVDLIEYRPLAGVLLAARRDGAIMVWAGMPMRELAGVYCASRSPDEAEAAALRAQPLSAYVAAPGIDPPAPGIDGEPLVRQLVLDKAVPVEHGVQVTYLVHYAHSRVFLRHRVTLARGAPHTLEKTVFGARGSSPITALRCDFDVRPSTAASLPTTLRARVQEAKFQERKFVVAGTASGGIGIWNWDGAGEPCDAEEQGRWQRTTPEAALRADTQMEPAHVFEGHHNAITALAITPSLVLAGCEDGTVKSLCALTGAVVRTFNDRTARRHPARLLASGALSADQAALYRVNQIVADDEMFVAAIGSQLLAWRTQAAVDAAAPDAAKAARTRSRGAAVPDSKLRLRADLERAVQEGHDQLLLEREEREAHEEAQHAAHRAMFGELSEQDALDYALMLSRDEQEAEYRAAQRGGAGARSSEPGPSARPADELSPDLMYDQPELDLDLGEGESDASVLRGSPYELSPTLGPTPGPSSRAWDIVQCAGRRASTTNEVHSGSGSWNKLRTVAVPRSARLAASQSPSLHGVSPSSPGSVPESLGSSLGSTPLQLESNAEWPEMRERQCQSSKSPAPMGAWAKASPTLRAVDAPPRRSGRSALVDPSRYAPRSAPAEEEPDEELRLAMELSLAEYESQRAAEAAEAPDSAP